MNEKLIEKYYEDKKYEKVIKEMYDNANIYTDKHILRLFLRSANILSKKVYDVINEYLMKDDIDYIYNRFIHEDEFSKSSSLHLLSAILSNDRKDLLEEFILMYIEKYKEYPHSELLNEYIIINKNKEIVIDYVNSVEADKKDIFFNIVKLMLNKQDPVSFLEKAESPEIFISSYENFLKGHDLTVENFKKFFSGAKFKNNMFILFEEELYRIEKYDFENRMFFIEDKFGRKKQVKYSIIAGKTEPIEKDDFRVLKYFMPEEGHGIDPCRLVTMILKYRNSALDRNQIKDELVYIFGKETLSFLTKNKKVLEQCEDIEIIYEKPERYVLSQENENLIFNKVKRMRTISQVKEYMLSVMKSRKIENEDKERIVKHIESMREKHKNEILYLITEDGKYIKDVETDELKNATYIKFIFDVMMYKFSSGKINDENIEIIEKLDTQHIEKLYIAMNRLYRDNLLEMTQKSFRLGKNLRLIEWYLSFHINESLKEMAPDYTLLRSIMISNDVYAMRKIDEYLNFMRRFLFNPKKKKFLELIMTTEYNSGKRIFDEFMKILYLNDYQKDEIRSQIYSFRADYRDYKISDFMLSTKETIKKKQEEFAEITEKTLPKLSRMIKEASELGDLSENSEYKFAREQYRLFSLKAEEIKEQISKTEPIDFISVDGNKVEVGTIVTVLIKKDKIQKKYKILGIFDADADNNIISYKSPFAQKILGMKKNEENKEYKIIEILKMEEE